MYILVAVVFALFLGPALYGMDLWELFELWFGPDSAIYLNLFFLAVGVMSLGLAIPRIIVGFKNLYNDIKDK